MRLPSECPICGLTYQDFRTGYTWRDALDSFWRPAEPRTEWVNKTRRNILGRLWEMKQALWEQHLDNCGTVTIESEVTWELHEY